MGSRCIPDRFLFATCGPRMRDNPAGRIIALMIRRRGLGGRICHPSWTRPEIPPISTTPKPPETEV